MLVRREQHFDIAKAVGAPPAQPAHQLVDERTLVDNIAAGLPQRAAGVVASLVQQIADGLVDDRAGAGRRFDDLLRRAVRRVGRQKAIGILDYGRAGVAMARLKFLSMGKLNVDLGPVRPDEPGALGNQEPADLAEQLEQRDQLLLVRLRNAVRDDHKDVEVGVARGAAAAQGAEVEHPEHLGILCVMVGSYLYANITTKARRYEQRMADIAIL